MLQPSSSSPTSPRSTSPTSGNEHARDSAYVAPYLTHVVRHHGAFEPHLLASISCHGAHLFCSTAAGQLTLIPPENAGRLRKKGKKKSKSRLREEHYDEATLSSSSSHISAAHSLHTSHTLSRPRPILAHAARSEVGTSSSPGASVSGTASRSVHCYEGAHVEPW